MWLFFQTVAGDDSHTALRDLRSGKDTNADLGNPDPIIEGMFFFLILTLISNRQ